MFCLCDSYLLKSASKCNALFCFGNKSVEKDSKSVDDFYSFWLTYYLKCYIIKTQNDDEVFYEVTHRGISSKV